MFDNFYILFILMGLMLFMVVLYYNKILSNLLTVLSNLLKLQENRDTDIKEYIDSIESQLQKIGIDEISYDIAYSKKKIVKKHHNTKLNILKKDIYYKNISGEIAIGVRNNTGENKLINKLILFVITLQVVNAIHADIDKINESFERIAKLQTYMMHDLKNVLQFFQAMQYNIDHIKTDDEKKRFIEFLQTSTKPIDKKVNKILALLQVKSNFDTSYDIKEFQLEELFREYMIHYGLSCDIEGKATLLVDEESIRVVIDNILGNIKDKSYDRDIRCKVKIKEDDTYIHIDICDDGYPFVNPDEVFEPFYTTKEDGIGIGMYHVASVIENLSGTIICENIREHPYISIKIPVV